jgi:hypothetical protein
MQGNRSIGIAIVAVLLAGLACNAAGAESDDTAATVGAVYATITAQAEAAGLPITATEPASNGSEASTEGTEAPTATPTVTPTPPAERTGNGANITAPRCALSIAIDGSDGDWNDQNAAEIVADRATFGADQWTGADDASAHFKTCWTDEALFLLALVSDDVHVQTETGSTQWRGDEIELMFDSDLQGDYYNDRWNTDDSQFGLSPGDFADLPPNAVQYEPVQRDVESLQVAASRPIEVGGAYTLEAKVPWALLGASPAVDAKYGFCVAVSDNDQVGQASQDSLISHCTNLTVFNPTTWVTLTLGP